MNLDAAHIASLWQRLREPVPPLFSADALEERIIRDGWADITSLVDLLEFQDRRIHGLDVKAIVTALGIPLRSVYPRPNHRHDECFGILSVSAVDAAFVVTWFERVGFRTDATAFAERLRPSLAAASHLAREACDVLFLDANRHRLPPVSIASDLSDFTGLRTERWTTPAGYRALYTANGAGVAFALEVRAPKYRKLPEPRSVQCPKCGLSYMAGLREEASAHRRFHARHVAVHEPRPEPRLLHALEKDLDAAWVDFTAPKWKRAAMYERARQFRREFDYGLIQWDEPERREAEAVGFLFSYVEGRIVGACAFRPEWSGATTWRLDWVWICPSERRKGYLARQWDRFAQRFGRFEIEPPVSPSMAAFLGKIGR